MNRFALSIYIIRRQPSRSTAENSTRSRVSQESEAQPFLYSYNPVILYSSYQVVSLLIVFSDYFISKMRRPITVFLVLFLHSVNSKRYIVKDKISQTSRIVDSEKPDYDHGPGVAYYPSPDDDGTYVQVYFGDFGEEIPSATSIIPESDGGTPFFWIPPEDPRFYLYTRKNPTKPIQLHNNKHNTEAKGYFNPGAPVKIICHGWLSKYTKQFPQNIKNEYVSKTRTDPANVILVDWHRLAANPVYIPSAQSTLIVGQHTAKLIEKLISEGFTNLKKIHFIGHSLGAHVGGATAASLKKGKIARITGLDPAGPFFCRGPGQIRRLDRDDAEFVDVIHTSAGNYCEDPATDAMQLAEGKFGLNIHLGDIDFFPNGGEEQPGCDDGGAGCSHSRSHELLTESVQSKIGFRGCKCSSWQDYLDLKCHCKTHIPMGETCPPSADSGAYFLRTAESAPFANVRSV